MNRTKRRKFLAEGRVALMGELRDLEELRVLAPPPLVRPLSSERLTIRKALLMREVVQSLDPNGSRPPRVRRSHVSRRSRRRFRLPVLVAVLVFAGAAVGLAFLRSSPRDTVSVQCEIEGVSTVIPSGTDNPVADCAAQWRRDTGNAGPRLVAYDNGHGGITVLPADSTAPSGWTRLPSGAKQNEAMVEMQQWLDDYVNGLNSGCYENATAVAMTEKALTRLGMQNWTVQPPPADDDSPCVDTGILDGTTFTVALRALGGEHDAQMPFEKLAVRLRSIAKGCESLDATARQVRSAAAELGLSEGAREYELTEVRDDSARCTTIYEDVGGAIFLILRGPTR
jgi:hypothetical protein